mmetsp:Transcript_52591/g.127409  ORF Transcript_52591/g.127409 Transcript_52591/m.127409 type:complete len:80 (+) Transcript_52591:2316-2555(+)
MGRATQLICFLVDKYASLILKCYAPVYLDKCLALPSTISEKKRMGMKLYYLQHSNMSARTPVAVTSPPAPAPWTTSGLV